jgi:hypothetical protein
VSNLPGEEIAKPLGWQMKIMARIRHNEVYCSTTRKCTLKEAAEETCWDTIASCRRINTANVGSHCAVSRRQSYH